jgi:Ca2+-binding EF-hand superfamily protein
LAAGVWYGRITGRRFNRARPVLRLTIDGTAASVRNIHERVSVKRVFAAPIGALFVLAAGAATAQTVTTQPRPGATAAAPRTAAPKAAAPRPAAAAPAVQQKPAAAGKQPLSRAAFLSSVDSEFRKRDADKNGTVTRAELDAFERAVSVLKAQTQNRALFARLDADRNGHLSPAEFARLAAPRQPNVDAELARYDGNRDKAITLVEYRTGTLANFDRIDADKDGIATVAEMTSAGVGR